jgi:release factor glutamine methyltransferase
MKNSKLLFQDLAHRIAIDEDRSERENIALLIMEDVFGSSKTDLLKEKLLDVDAKQIALLDGYIDRLNAGEPIQHILGYAFFFGKKIKVNRQVLIPRPETEELIKICLEFVRDKPKRKVLDIGTGSGCIPITIKIETPNADVWATDVSKQALAVAQENADNHHAAVKFIEHDILMNDLPEGGFDLIISNPPYITESEKTSMQPQVLNHEPHLALFVADDDPLKFYKRITQQAFQHLNKHGMLAVEINHQFGKETVVVFQEANFQRVALIKDISGKDRFVTGIK